MRIVDQPELASDPTALSALRRAYENLDLRPIGGADPEALAIELTSLAKAHAVQARQHIYCLGPILTIVRDRQLYSHHPERFGTFREWLEQPEISLSESLAYDVINWWKYATPRLESLGIAPLDVVENIDVSKLRLLVSPIKRAADSGAPLSDEDLVDLVQAAAGLTWSELHRHIRPQSVHNPVPADNPDYVGDPDEEDEPDPELLFTVTVLPNGRYRLQAEFTEPEMHWLAKRTRPTWLDQNGRILRLDAR